VSFAYKEYNPEEGLSAEELFYDVDLRLLVKKKLGGKIGSK